MSMIRIVYHERLGDILRCLPIAKHFADLGHEVRIECKPEYAALFRRVHYCSYASPGTGIHGETVLDLQIWPKRFDEFTASGLNWMDFVYGQIQGGSQINRQICVNAGGLAPAWVSEVCLVFPNGYSHMNAPTPLMVVAQAHQLFPGAPVLVLGKSDLGCFELPSIEHLIDYIAAAKHVLTVNTSASIIASAVRKSWHHIPDLSPQHDFIHAGQVRVERLG